MEDELKLTRWVALFILACSIGGCCRADSLNSAMQSGVVIGLSVCLFMYTFSDKMGLKNDR